MKRRDFLKGLAGVVTGAVVAPSIVKAKPKRWLRTEKEYTEARAEVKAKRPDGAYLETSELKCLRCGHIHKLRKGYYEFGTRVVCRCGNMSTFMYNVPVAT